MVMTVTTRATRATRKRSHVWDATLAKRRRCSRRRYVVDVGENSGVDDDCKNAAERTLATKAKSHNDNEEQQESSTIEESSFTTRTTSVRNSGDLSFGTGKQGSHTSVVDYHSRSSPFPTRAARTAPTGDNSSVSSTPSPSTVPEGCASVLSQTAEPAMKPPPPSTLHNSSGKGISLRELSRMVCDKVREKGITTHKEVADELVVAIMERECNRPTTNNHNSNGKQRQDDAKNIRRRIYDALNVIMAVDIIARDRRNITWKGYPTTQISTNDSPTRVSSAPTPTSTARGTTNPSFSTKNGEVQCANSKGKQELGEGRIGQTSSNGDSKDVALLEEELKRRKNDIQRKRQAMRDLLIQHVCFHNLIRHNYHRRQQQMQTISKNTKDENSKSNNNNAQNDDDHQAPRSCGNLSLPFLLVNTNKHTIIEQYNNWTGFYGVPPHRRRPPLASSRQARPDSHYNPDMDEYRRHARPPPPRMSQQTLAAEDAEEQDHPRNTFNVLLCFNRPFAVSDHNYILRQLGMHRTTMDVLSKIVPNELVQYSKEQNLLNDFVTADTRA